MPRGHAFIRERLADAAFRFVSPADLQRTVFGASTANLQAVRSIELDGRWIRPLPSSGIPSVFLGPQEELAALIQFPSLHLLRVCIGPIDNEDGYECR